MHGVYPRVCGGTVSPAVTDVTSVGLSPRVRGNLWSAEIYVRKIRSIPACAGEPDLSYLSYYITMVYPRVCGGTFFFNICGVLEKGLSPRVRGNLMKGRGQLLRLRSIPACAGEPFLLSSPIQPASVYPRVCGGTIRPRHRRGVEQGLSPRVRGNHRPPGWVVSKRGSIPASDRTRRHVHGSPALAGIDPPVLPLTP